MMGLLFKSTGIILMCFFPPAGFISVIFVCNASGTLKLCSHTCSQSTQSSQRDPPRLGGRCVRHIQISAFHISTHTVALLSCWCMLLKPAIFPKYREERGRALKADHCTIIYHQLQTHKMKGKLNFLCLYVCLKCTCSRSLYRPCVLNRNAFKYTDSLYGSTCTTLNLHVP